MKHLREIFEPKPRDIKAAIAAMPVKKDHKSKPTEDDKLFKATNIKQMERPGKSYKNGEDEKAYDNGRASGVNDQKPIKGALPPTVTYEEEQIDELSRRGPLSNYINKTRDDPKREKGNALALKKKWGNKKYGLPEPKIKATEEVELAEDEGLIYEDTKITKQGHETLKAFSEKRAHESKKFSTDGKSLHGNWMGGKNIASWDGNKVRMGNLDSRSKQTVQRALRKKHLAPNDIHESVNEENKDRLWRIRGVHDSGNKFELKVRAKSHAEAITNAKAKHKITDKHIRDVVLHEETEAEYIKRTGSNSGYGQKYNAGSVEKAIKNNPTGKIGKGEAKKIHRLLKGWRGDGR